jgi:integrase
MPRLKTGAKRGNREDSVYQRKDGRWQVQVALPGDGRGQRRRKWFLGKTRAEAVRNAAEFKASLLTGQSAPTRDVTVRAAAAEWLLDARPTVRHKTWEAYSSVLRNHVLGHIGDIKLADLSPGDLERLYRVLAGEGKAPATINKIHRVLHRMLEHHRRREAVARNVASLVKPPAFKQREKVMLSLSQIKGLLDAAKCHRQEALIVLAVTTGARSGELLGLTWDCVDFERGEIKINKSLQKQEHGFALGETKTRASRRTVALSSLAREALARHRQRQEREARDAVVWQNDEGFVFTTTAGTKLNSANVLRRDFRPLLRQAGLPDTLRFHDLRDIAASLALTQQPVTEVAAMLGHSNPATTLRVYAHALPGGGRNIARTMDGLLGDSAS